MDGFAIAMTLAALAATTTDHEVVSSSPACELTQSAKLQCIFDVNLSKTSEAISWSFLEETAPLPFGTAGSTRWHLGSAVGVQVSKSRNSFAQVGFGLSYFVIENLSLDAEFNVMYFHQRGDDAFGANFNLSFRHHLIMKERWSFFADAGAGMLGTTEPVPSGGSRFNFVPHAGVGLSFDVGSDVRLLTGVRWHHISNANTYRRNPGRDSVQAYASLSFPF